MSRARAILLFLLLALPGLPVVLTLGGCAMSVPPDTNWATRSTATQPAEQNELQALLTAYGEALVNKDRARFASLLDPGSPDFTRQQLQLFDQMKDVPFAQYAVHLDSRTEPQPGTAIVKVSTAWSFAGSFTQAAQPDRSAFTLVKRQDGWKLAADATQQALGRPRTVQLWDLGTVAVLKGDHILALYHAGQGATAHQVVSEGDAAWPRLARALPNISLPLIPVLVFDDKAQIDQAMPGKWQEWTGGAARMLGPAPEQGGEIIIDSALYQQANAASPGYNGKMIGHEMTHVALFPQQAAVTPPLLVEGLADFVGGEKQTAMLRQKLAAGERLNPGLDDLCQPSGFQALLSPEAADLAYQEADTAVLYLEQKYGSGRTLDLLREFKRREHDHADQQQLLDEVFRSVLGTGFSDFENSWRRFVLTGNV